MTSQDHMNLAIIEVLEMTIKELRRGTSPQSWDDMTGLQKRIQELKTVCLNQRANPSQT